MAAQPKKKTKRIVSEADLDDDPLDNLDELDGVNESESRNEDLDKEEDDETKELDFDADASYGRMSDFANDSDDWD